MGGGTIEDISQRLQQAIKARREAEKALEQIVLEREKLLVQRDMLYDIVNLLGADMSRQAERIVKKFAKLLEMRNDLKSDLATTTLTDIHKNTILLQIDEYVKDISKAFDENELDKAISHLKNMVSVIKTAMS